MKRNIRTLVLTSVTGLALAAVVTSATSASSLTAGATSGKLTETLSGEQVFTMFPGTLRCTTSHQEGSFTSPNIEEITLSATYGGCKPFGILVAEFKMNGCTYTISGKSQPANTAAAQIVCPAGNEITIVTFTCTIHIEPQILVGHTVFENEASDVKATYTFEGIKYTETTGCPNVEINATTSDGTYTGSSTMKATNTAGGAVSLSSD